jgi:DNA-binding transcriptional regulator YdaS (Cro superfamily)
MILKDGVRLAIKAAGSATELADLLHIRPQAVVQWRRVPKLRALEIEELLGVPRFKMRPDLWRKVKT